MSRNSTRELTAKDRIIFPLDVSSVDQAHKLVDQLDEDVGCCKIGLEIQSHMQASIISAGSLDAAMQAASNMWSLFSRLNGDFFWDGKWKDIPATVAGAAGALQPIRARMINVHASGGPAMIQEAAANKGDALLLAVTILTSMDEETCRMVYGKPPLEKVIELALEAEAAGADGIICSPQELIELKLLPELASMVFVTPGVRPAWASADDQKRVMTPGEAIKAGATYVVVGRPIRKPPAHIGSPAAAAKLIAEEIEEALVG